VEFVAFIGGPSTTAITFKWEDAVTINNIIYVLPSSAEKIIMINTDNDSIDVLT